MEKIAHSILSNFINENEEMSTLFVKRRQLKRIWKQWKSRHRNQNRNYLRANMYGFRGLCGMRFSVFLFVCFDFVGFFFGFHNYIEKEMSHHRLTFLFEDAVLCVWCLCDRLETTWLRKTCYHLSFIHTVFLSHGQINVYTA